MDKIDKFLKAVGLMRTSKARKYLTRLNVDLAGPLATASESSAKLGKTAREAREEAARQARIAADAAKGQAELDEARGFFS